MGMSHGGEMAFKIASEYHGVRAMIASEPAAHEFLRLRPDAGARINPATGLLDVERMLMRDIETVRARITSDVARQRKSTIRTPIFVQGRNSDELQGIFTVCHELLAELGKEAQWKTYEHDEMVSSTCGATQTAGMIPIPYRSRRSTIPSRSSTNI